MNLFTELQKRGYQMTLERVADRSYWYCKPEQKRKDLIQELALVVNWIFENFDVDISIYGRLPYLQYSDSEYGEGELKWHFEYRIIKNKDGQKCEVVEPKDWFETKEEATIAAIEFLIENKLI